MPKRLTYDEICASVNKISDGKTKLISEEYVNSRTPLLFQCQCGKPFSRTYEKFSYGRIKCPDCTMESRKEKLKLDINDIISEIEKTGCQYISGKYVNNDSKLNIRCRCGNTFTKSWGKFMSGQDRCVECGNNIVRESKRKYTTENAKEILQQYGYTMIGNFIDGATKVECICKNQHKCYITLSQLLYERHTGCHECAREKLKGEGHPNYKGGITILSDCIRESLIPWITETKELYNYTCPITHQKWDDIVVHHLYALSNIFNDVCDEMNIDLNIRETIKNNSLTEDEKQLIVSEILKKHDDTTGIVIHKDIHKKFHQQYGYGGNTPEQFDEFLRNNYNLSLSQIQVK